MSPDMLICLFTKQMAHDKLRSASITLFCRTRLSRLCPNWTSVLQSGPASPAGSVEETTSKRKYRGWAWVTDSVWVCHGDTQICGIWCQSVFTHRCLFTRPKWAELKLTLAIKEVTLSKKSFEKFLLTWEQGFPKTVVANVTNLATLLAAM